MSLSTASFLFVLLASNSVFSDNVRTQSFELIEGWNAIWLAVEPVHSDPSEVFSHVPIDIVAAYDGVFSTRQFASNPSADLLSELGWGLWYAPDRADSFLSVLSAIHGQKSYLLHATSACVLNIVGSVEVFRMQWQPNAYNLAGFSLDPVSPPSFAQFFSASKAHQACVIYRLVNGVWQKVIEPENDAMRAGEAFWIYCDGSSSYQGPLRMDAVSLGGIILGERGDEMVLHNETAHPLSPTISHIATGANSVPIAMVVDVVGDNAHIEPVQVPMLETDWSLSLPPLEADGSIRIPLALQSEKMTAAEAQSLLCIKTDIGTEIWLPVLGLREDLK